MNECALFASQRVSGADFSSAFYLCYGYTSRYLQQIRIDDISLIITNYVDQRLFWINNTDFSKVDTIIQTDNEKTNYKIECQFKQQTQNPQSKLINYQATSTIVFGPSIQRLIQFYNYTKNTSKIIVNVELKTDTECITTGIGLMQEVFAKYFAKKV